MKIEYPKLSCADFGKALIQTKDLDPVYVALTYADLPTPQLYRTCLAYWCLYHLGAAAKLGELKTDKEFLQQLHVAAVNEGLKWPRGSERRHWRGQQAINSCASVAWNVEQHGSVQKLISHLASTKFSNINVRVRNITGFGPWIAFKVADMLERVLRFPVDFSDCELGFYDEPRKGAGLYLKLRQPDETLPVQLRVAIAKLRKELGPLKAPPFGDRVINVQELETVLCKWKSHMNDTYRVGKDSVEVKHHLEGWGDTAQELSKYVPKFDPKTFTHTPFKLGKLQLRIKL